MLFEVALRSIVFLLPALALIGGCDRPSPSTGQANERTADAPGRDQANDVASDEAAAKPNSGVDLVGTVDRSHKGDPAPAVGFTGPEGANLTLAGFVGKPFLLNLWATWCGPCKVEMPALEKVASEGKLRVVTVSQDLDGAAKVMPYFAQKGFKALKPYLDPKMDLSVALGGPSLPTTILYDARAHEVWRVTGGKDWTSPGARELLAQAH